MNEKKHLTTGIALVVIGLAIALAGSFVVHMAEADEFNNIGQEIYPSVPRGWVLATFAQMIALGGALVAMAGVTYGWVYQRTLTWARAMLGALLFTGLMFVLFAIIPNQFLTLTQSTLEWTPQRIFITIPPILVLNNEVAISYAALKDMISAGYVTALLFIIPIVMYRWQDKEKKADTPKPAPVSDYGRPLRVDR
ncbi:MAG: hypothetical protein ABFR95_10090 [Actinomycetota bacterium]